MDQLPSDWKKNAKIVGVNKPANPKLNKYRVKSRKSLQEWQEKGWTTELSPRGWFQWYVLYFLGRRDEKEDTKQIKRWKSYVARHQGQINANCHLSDHTCRPRQRQGLLQWAWDSTEDYSDQNIKQRNLEHIKQEASKYKNFNWEKIKL